MVMSDCSKKLTAEIQNISLVNNRSKYNLLKSNNSKLNAFL